MAKPINLLIMLAFPLLAIAKGSGGLPVDPGTLFVGKDAPPGTVVKLEKAAGIALKNPLCKKVIMGGYTPKREARNPMHPDAAYFVTCSGTKGIPFNMFFTDSQLKGTGQSYESPEPVSDSEALLMCMKAVRARLRYPSSAHFNPLSNQVGTNGTLNQRVVLDFTALNGFGNRVPKSGVCIITPSAHVDVSITNC